RPARRDGGSRDVDGGRRLLGYAFPAEARAALDAPDLGPAAPASAVMRPADTVRPGTPAVEVLTALASSELGRLCVVDPTGRLVGIVGKTDVIEALRRA